MKTLMIVTGSVGFGGLERMTCFVANKFRSMGWNVVILTLLQKNRNNDVYSFLDPEVEIIPYCGKNDPEKQKKRSLFTWLKMIKSAIKKHNPDSILAMTFKVASLVSIASPKFAKRVTIREISDPKSKARNQFVNKLTELFCRNVKNIIFQTNWEQSCFGKRIRNKGVVIPNPISISRTSKGNYSIKKFFTMTRLSIFQKRQDVLIEAFDIFHKKHPDYCLEIYGRGPDKELLQDMIDKTSCPESIMLCNPIADIHKKVLDYRAFIITSDFEGMSNALLEAYYLGIPCISSDWPGVEDVVTNKTDGLIYKRQNVDELVSLMEEIVTNDELCSSLSSNAVGNADRFNQEDIFGRYYEVISHD